MGKQTIEVRGGGDTVVLKAALTAHIIKEKPGMYVSYCPALDVCSQGATIREAKANIIEATQLLIETCYERGTLHRLLTTRGFHSKSRRRAKPPVDLTAARSTFRIPAEVPLVAHC